MQMKWMIAMLAALSMSSVANAGGSSLACEVGPVQRQFGQSQWNVYACTDEKSVVVVPIAATNGEFGYFFLTPAGQEIVVTGEGWGEDASFQPSFQQLKELDSRDLADLVKAAESVNGKPKSDEASADAENPKAQAGD